MDRWARERRERTASEGSVVCQKFTYELLELFLKVGARAKKKKKNVPL